jgi:hypothetical protein
MKFKNAVYCLKVHVYGWGHAITAIIFINPLRVCGILGSWEAESFRTKYCEIQKIY